MHPAKSIPEASAVNAAKSRKKALFSSRIDDFTCLPLHGLHHERQKIQAKISLSTTPKESERSAGKTERFKLSEDPSQKSVNFV
jgi:hypothetical protein